MESSIFLLICLSGPLLFAIVLGLMGLVGGLVTAGILKQLNPGLVAKKMRSIVLNWTVACALGGLVGGVLFGLGFGTYMIAGFSTGTIQSVGWSIAVGCFLFGGIAGALGSFLTFRHFAPDPGGDVAEV
jgi:hypothetical protein